MTNTPTDDGTALFIVAEIATNWPKPWPVPTCELIGAKFEQVIEVNRERGYRLHSWSLNRLMVSTVAGAEELNETIVAVFERVTS